MRQGQVTLFILVGLVLVISIGVIFWVTSSLRGGVSPEIDEDVTLARTCLAQTTRNALMMLHDDGMVTADEGGAMQRPATGVSYLKRGSVDDNTPLGEYAYKGLCDRAGPNAPTANTYYCPPATYAMPGTFSVQAGLEQAITAQMNECLDTVGRATVTIQQDALQVDWDEPAITHREQVPIQSAWVVIERLVREEVSDATHDFEDPIACQRCDQVRFFREDAEKTEENPFDTFAINDVRGGLLARVNLENRPFLYYEDSYHEGLIDDLACAEETCAFTILSPDEDPLGELDISLPQANIDYDADAICDDEGDDAPCFAQFSVEPGPTERASQYTITMRPSCDVNRVYRVRAIDPAGEVITLEIRAATPGQEACQQ